MQTQADINPVIFHTDTANPHTLGATGAGWISTLAQTAVQETGLPAGQVIVVACTLADTDQAVADAVADAAVFAGRPLAESKAVQIRIPNNGRWSDLVAIGIPIS